MIFAILGYILFYMFFWLLNSYVTLFPLSIPAANALSLLNVTIQIDGILLGFVSLIAASLLNDVSSQLSVFRAQMREGRIKQLYVLRSRGVFLTSLVALSLSGSILWTLSRIGGVAESMPRGDLNNSFELLFLGIAMTIGLIYIGSGREETT